MEKIFVFAAMVFSFLCSNAQVKNEKSKQELIQEIDSSYSIKLHQKEHRKFTGKCKFCGMPLNLSAKEKMKYEVMYPYSCPMNHNPKNAIDNKCPKCGKKIKK
jgi:hypothetical protein